MKRHITLTGVDDEATFDCLCVDLFAIDMKLKLDAARAKGRAGWYDDCTKLRLIELFAQHLRKDNEGNLVDLANLLMMMQARGVTAKELSQFIKG